MTRILYFTRDYTTHDHRFLSALAQTEHKVYYLRLERQGHQLEDRPLPPEIEQVQWRGGDGPVRLKDGPGLLADLKRVIRSIRPDLIQAGPIQRCALLAALTGFHPLLGMSWGYDLIFDAGRSPLWRWATRYTLKHSDMLLGDSQIIRQLAISHGMPDERIVTFPWGIDLQHFCPPAQQTPAEGPFTLLSTRNWEPIYGVDVIARAVSSVQQTLEARQAAAEAKNGAPETGAAQTGPDLRLVMLGNGSQAAMLRQILMKGGFNERVSFPGQVSFTNLPNYYHMADLYIAASHSDGTSISLLEAMACGRPVLVSDIPGNREWVTPGENGWLFPDGDDKVLANAILHAIQQRAELPDMGRRARQIAEERADWNKNFQQLLGIYKKMVN